MGFQCESFECKNYGAKHGSISFGNVELRAWLCSKHWKNNNTKVSLVIAGPPHPREWSESRDKRVESTTTTN